MKVTLKRLLICLTVLLAASVAASAQSTINCNTNGLKKPKFTVVSDSSGDKKVHMDLVIKKSKQTDDNLRAVAKYLKAQFCEAETFYVSIFDNRRDAREFTIYEVRVIPDTMRAMYVLKRAEKYESLVRMKVVNSMTIETEIGLE